jgi:hypothetical protein
MTASRRISNFCFDQRLHKLIETGIEKAAGIIDPQRL